MKKKEISNRLNRMTFKAAFTSFSIPGKNVRNVRAVGLEG